MDKEPEARAWWQTLPGVLTAVAGMVTAVAGLVVALHQAGILQRGNPGNPQNQAAAAASTARADASAQSAVPGGASKPAPVGVAAAGTASLPADIKITAGHAVYDILSARLDRHSPGKRSLKFQLRMTNTDRYDQNFWAASFRLQVDGILQAPVNDLNELVPGNSAKEGWVEFVIPDSTREVGLQVGEVGEGAPISRIVLNAATPR